MKEKLKRNPHSLEPACVRKSQQKSIEKGWLEAGLAAAESMWRKVSV